MRMNVGTVLTARDSTEQQTMSQDPKQRFLIRNFQSVNNRWVTEAQGLTVFIAVSLGQVHDNRSAHDY